MSLDKFLDVDIIISDNYTLLCKANLVHKKLNTNIMDLNQIKSMIEDLLVEYKKINITLMGIDELNIINSTVIPLFEYISSNNLNINLNLQTDGSILTEEILNKLSIYFYLIILLINDYSANNLNLILKYKPDTIIKYIIEPSEINLLFDNYYKLSLLNILTLSLLVNPYSNWSHLDIIKLNTELYKIQDFYATLFSNNKIGLIPELIKQSFNKFVKNFKETCNKIIIYNNKIYKCSHNLTEQELKLNSNFKENTCLNCNLCNKCNPINCYYINYKINDNLYIKPNILCEYDKMLYNLVLLLLNNNKLKNNIFKLYFWFNINRGEYNVN